MRRMLYALGFVVLCTVATFTQATGGAFLPGFDYNISGNWTHSGTTAFTGVATLTSPVITGATGAQATTNATATLALAAADSGRTVFLNSATEFVTTLPAPAAGLRFTVIVAAAPASASYTVVTSGSSNVLKGLQNSVAGDAGDSGTADDTVTFVDGQAVAGDKCEFFSDGTSWFAFGISKVAAGLTFTQAN